MNTKRIQHLDALRGLLALLVLIYHVPQVSRTVGLPNFSDWPIFQKGPDAVKVFFMLSGFLIVGLLYDEKKTFGRIDIKHFYLRRILRLYPVYYLVLIFGFVYYHYLLPLFHVPFDIQYNLFEGILWTVGFLPNVFKELHDPGGILMILWSIGIEEQFYLIIAPVLLLIPIKKYIQSLLVFSILYFVLYHIEWFSILKRFHFLYFFISFGGCLAVLLRLGVPVYFKSLALRILVYITFILYFTTNWFRLDSLVLNHAMEVIVFGLFIVNLANEDSLNKQFKPLNYLGTISYGIYMYHSIAIHLVLFVTLKIQSYIPFGPVGIICVINATSILGTIVISHISYNYYEQYFLLIKNRFRKHPT